MRRVEGSVEQIVCRHCSASFPTIAFSGDTDMATDGLVAATSVEHGALALGELTGEEFAAGYPIGPRNFAARASREIGQAMVAIEVVRYEPRGEPVDRDFQAFRGSLRRQRAVYRCPRCAGEAVAAGQLSLQAFQESGRLRLLDKLAL